MTTIPFTPHPRGGDYPFLPLVTVSILSPSGKQVVGRVLLDSGSECSFVMASWIDPSAGDPVDGFSTQTIVGITGSVTHRIASHVTVDAWGKEVQLTRPIVWINPAEPIMGLPTYVGILGLDFLNQHRVTLDNGAQIIV